MLAAPSLGFLTPSGFPGGAPYSRPPLISRAMSVNRRVTPPAVSAGPSPGHGPTGRQPRNAAGGVAALPSPILPAAAGRVAAGWRGQLGEAGGPAPGSELLAPGAGARGHPEGRPGPAGGQAAPRQPGRGLL